MAGHDLALDGYPGSRVESSIGPRIRGWSVASNGESLLELVRQAKSASPATRIDLRDPIARFGDVGIEAVVPWLGDPTLYRFAVRVVVRAAELGAKPAAAAALLRALEAEYGVEIKTELNSGLNQLGIARRTPAGRQSRADSKTAAPRQGIAELVIGRSYKRRELHDSGLGGNRQSGISYPADGDYVLLFSDPSAATEHGYRDRWIGDGLYRYYGAWDGTGDMTLTAGNSKLIERSPNLLLFLKAAGAWRFEGYFECGSHQPERTVRDGRQYNAIVFDLRKLTLGSKGGSRSG
jgi:hypothetical protein